MIEHTSVPITLALATRLKVTAKGRAPDAPLLTRSDGQPWSRDPSQDYRCEVRAIIADLGFDDAVTPYALRHSSIVRMLLKSVPIRLVASLHDTSTKQIEAHYSHKIAEVSDEHARIGLLEEPADAKVVLLKSRRG